MTYWMMYTDDGKEFKNPSEEAKEKFAFAIIYQVGTSFDHKVIIQSSYDWTGEGKNFSPGYFSLRDKNGEVRNRKRQEFHEAIKFPSWEAFDAYKVKEQLQKAQKQIKNYEKMYEEICSENRYLLSVLNNIYDINEQAGTGSRKKVRDIILRFTAPCETCSRANCICDDKE